MKEFKSQLPWVMLGLVGLVYPAVSQSKDSTLPDNYVLENRPLTIVVTVNDPTFLKVKLGDEIKVGDIISDDSQAREKLKQRQERLLLQISHLKSQSFIKPTPPPTPLKLPPLPPPDFGEELTTIAEDELKLQQVKSTLVSRRQLRKLASPEQKAEFAKSQAARESIQQKVAEQTQMIATMNNLNLSPQILQHENSKLKELRSEFDQSQASLDVAQAKLESFAISQQQELGQLEVNVNLAKSHLNIAKSRLKAAKHQRLLQEHEFVLHRSRQINDQVASQQRYERQQLQYQQALRDQDYQLGQLQISLGIIEDKLTEIPLVRSPRHGYIKKIQPWSGKDGQYTTAITIVSALDYPREDRHSQGGKTNSSPGKNPNTNE